MYITDVHAIGLDAAQGLYLTTAFYWDRNEASREWSKRFYERTKAMPSMGQAGVYSGVMHYLEAVRQAGTTDTTTVRKKMGEIKVRSEEHTSELQSLMRSSYAVFCLTKKK